MDRGDAAGPTYARLIGRMALGHEISEAEVEGVTDPDLFRDAILLASRGQWTPEALDGTDALLLALVRRLTNTRVRRSSG